LHFSKFSWFMGLLLLAACQSSPSERVTLGETLAQVDFSEIYQWENYANDDQHVNFRIEDGAYRAQAWDEGFVWVLNAQQHTDVSIQVDTVQNSDYANNAYGLMCRAAPTNNGDGYYFLISGDGNYTIRRGATDSIAPLIRWTPSGAIQQGRAINRIRIVCVEDYLALYVNGQFVAEIRDDFYQRGFAGLAAGVVEDGNVDITFDNLEIVTATLNDSD